MSVYAIAVFLHIVGALGPFAALALEWASLSNLRRASTLDQLREWTRLLGVLRRLGGPAALTILITGIYLTATRWGQQAWIVAGLGGLVLLAALGGALSGRRFGAIARAVPALGGPIPADLARRLHDPVLVLSAWVRTALALGVVFVMSAKPNTAGALTALGAALVLGLAVGMPAGGGHQPAPAASRRAES